MYYKLNKKTKEYEKVNWLTTFAKVIMITLVSCIFLIANIGLTGPTEAQPNMIPNTEFIIVKKADNFSEKKLIQEIKSYHLKYPYIVLAQSMLETGHWKSKVFIENHNLFGMREAKLRPTVALGTKNKHAYYGNWRESVQDYALYYSSYLFKRRDISEKRFYAYLDKTYAKGSNYSKKLRMIVKKYHLKEKFETKDSN